MRQKRYFQTASYGRQSPRRSSLLLGILLGILLGVTAVVAVAIYLNYVSSPFTHSDEASQRTEQSKAGNTDKLLSLTHITPSQVRSPSKPSQTRSSEDLQEASGVNAKDFDFYKILPGKSEAILKNKALAKKIEPRALRCYLQVGSFQEAKDANNLKAKLALIGIHASIQSVKIEGRGLLHRIRIGPIPDTSVDPISALLEQNGIQATLVRSL